MGGNALKDIKTRRYSKQEYDVALSNISRVLSEKLDVLNLDIPSYRQKKDFGDLDLLVEKEKLDQLGLLDYIDKQKYKPLVDFLQDNFNSRSFFINDNILSFEYRENLHEEEGFQVDLIITPKKEMSVARDYFSYNDLGNLIGRVAHKLGLSFGHRGLIYPFRDGSHLVSKILVSENVEDIFRFLDFDYKKFKQGFDSLEDIYQYATTSKYFNPEIYLFENQNHKSRTRDRKRTTYQGFLKYLQDKEFENTYQFDSDKNNYLPLIFNHFPDFKQKYFKVKEELEKSKEIKILFNGTNLSKWTGAQGKYLSGFISHMRSLFKDSDELLKFLQEGGEDALRVKTVEEFEKYKIKNPIEKNKKIKFK